ncbi:MAG: hypothetical protein DWI30_01615 [Chloroflexi bacterium]|nr:MAG: hypothetical protein DWI30_01615 [Chloroflexota bacterium]
MQYICKRTSQKPALDGRLASPVWQRAARSPRFVDMISGAPGPFDTQCSVVWDDDALYVGFWVEEPFVTATQATRDALVFLENDVEVFIDGGDCYYEFEINALGTIYEVFFVWQDAWRKGSYWDTPEFDVHDHAAILFGGNHDRVGQHFWRGTHPRGLRWAYRDWDMPGLQSAVFVDGQINNPAVVDKGWRVELAFPWSGMKHLGQGRSLPPKAGDEWNIFFGRFQRLELAGQVVSQPAAWSWGAVGSNDNHIPERFTKIIFSDDDVMAQP